MTPIDPVRWKAWLYCQKWWALVSKNCRTLGRDGGIEPWEYGPECAWAMQYMVRASIYQSPPAYLDDEDWTLLDEEPH